MQFCVHSFNTEYPLRYSPLQSLTLVMTDLITLGYSYLAKDTLIVGLYQCHFDKVFIV